MHIEWLTTFTRKCATCIITMSCILLASQTSIAAPSLVGFDFSGDLAVVVVDSGCAEAGGTDGRRDAGIFPAHVPVVALSRSPPPSAGTRSVC